MTFEEILDHAIAMLQRRGRLTYSTLKRQFQIDDAALEDLKNELLYAHPAAAYLLSGRREDAIVHGERALAREHKERGHEAWALRLLEIAARHDPPQVGAAEAHYQQALALADELGMRPLMAHCHHGLGTLYAVTGQQEQARTALSAAIALYRAIDMTFWLPPAEAALGQLQAHPC